MSNDNPYLSPTQPAAPPIVNPGASVGPPWFSAVAILMIVMGALGLIASLFGGLGLLTPQPPELAEVAARWFMFSVVESIYHLGVSLAILIGAILVLRRASSGLAPLSVGAALAIPYQVISLILSVMVIDETLKAVPRSGAAGAAEEAILTATFWMSVFTYSIWSIMVVAMLVIAILYLKRPEVRAHCNRA